MMSASQGIQRGRLKMVYRFAIGALRRAVTATACARSVKGLLAGLGVLAACAMPATAGAATKLAQQNAIRSAQEFLQTEAFSKQGLIQQLDSPYGAKFPKALAIYAVDHLRVNWNAQAVRAAKEFLQTQSFSCEGLVQQLDSPYGAQFTQAQAEYGAKKIGLC
jgi:Host cell surface-exposed lipoprotein